MECSWGDPLTRLAQALGSGGGFRLTVEGDSMRPSLEPGDCVIAEPLRGRTPEPGDVVVIRGVGDRAAVHRVVARQRRRTGWLLATIGDAMRHLDGVVGEASILGYVVAVERQGSQLPIPQHDVGPWRRLRARWELLLHGRVGERHPLRSVPRTLARLVRGARDCMLAAMGPRRGR